MMACWEDGEERRGEVWFGLKSPFIERLQAGNTNYLFIYFRITTTTKSTPTTQGEFQICISKSLSSRTEHKTSPTAHIHLKTSKVSIIL